MLLEIEYAFFYLRRSLNVLDRIIHSAKTSMIGVLNIDELSNRDGNNWIP